MILRPRADNGVTTRDNDRERGTRKQQDREHDRFADGNKRTAGRQVENSSSGGQRQEDDRHRPCDPVDGSKPGAVGDCCQKHNPAECDQGVQQRFVFVLRQAISNRRRVAAGPRRGSPTLEWCGHPDCLVGNRCANRERLRAPAQFLPVQGVATHRQGRSGCR